MTPYVLVSRFDRLGDLILSLPVLRHLERGGFAKPWLHCSPYAKAVGEWAQYNHLAAGLWVGGENPPAELQELTSKQLCGLSLFHCRETVEAFKSLKISETWGPRSKISALWSYRRTIYQKRSHVEKSEMEYNIDLAQALLLQQGFEAPEFEGLPALKVPPEWKSPYPAADCLIVASNGASAQNWPMQKYLDFAQDCLAKGRSVQFLIHGQDAEERKKIFSQSPLFDRVELLNSFSDLRELVAHIASCTETVSSSTGPLHLAHAAGRAVLGIYPTRPKVQTFKRWRPAGYWHAAPVRWLSIS
jgi:ADP-heptose:LPS heptosyltransferase